MNDLINSFDWLSIKKNEAYPVFTNASTNDTLPWPDQLDSKKPGQVNAFFRWKDVVETAGKIEMSLFVVSPQDLKTTFEIPMEAVADVSLRRLQMLKVAPGATVHWRFGAASGNTQTDRTGVVTVPRLVLTTTPVRLTVQIKK